MSEIMNEDLKSSEGRARPQVKWADLSMHTLRLVVAYDPENQRKRLCIVGSLSAQQRRILKREDYYEEQGLMFKNELSFSLAQLSNVFPYARVVSKSMEEIGVVASELPALHQELKKLAAARPSIATAVNEAQDDLARIPAFARPLLSIEPVPFSSRFSSVRSHLAHVDFNRLKKSIFVRAGYRCEICSATGFDQGHHHPVECHEVFEFDDAKGTQKMTKLMSLCPRCHAVKNIELTRAKSDAAFDTALELLASVNGWNKSQALTYYRHSVHVWNERSKRSWVLNLDLLDGTGLRFPDDSSSIVRRMKRPRDKNSLYLSQLPLGSLKSYAQVGAQSEI